VKPGLLTRCARPRIGRHSSYTVLGFTGYVAASVFVAALGWVWDFTLEERLISLLAPPLAFLACVTIATAIAGREWIVFYQTDASIIAAVALASWLTGANVRHTLDAAILGVGVFLCIGRLGCFSVACCHGKPWRWGVQYGHEHVVAGFWSRWRGRTLAPIQLVESTASLALVITALATGGGGLVYIAGYAPLRFCFELGRGDPVRPYALGLSEGQWWSWGWSVACAVVHPAWWTIALAVLVTLGAATLIALRDRRALLSPPHLRALDETTRAAAADSSGTRHTTPLGMAVSCHALPDGRTDWVLSSSHRAWSPALAERLASMLWGPHDLRTGQTKGIVHVIVDWREKVSA
jgi:hypothetical protein